MAKKVVISGYYGFGNFGDEAILSILVSKLKSMGCEIVVLSSNPRKTSMDLYVNAIYSFDFTHVSGLIKNSDILISGGGSLLQDVTSLKSLLYYLWIIFVALVYKKKVIIFAQGIGPINNNFARKIVSYLLKKCDYVSVRDEKSKDLLDGWGVKVNLLCDPVFSFNLPISNKSGVVGIQLRDFTTMNDALLKKLAKQIAKDFPDKKIEVYSFQDKLDLSLCENFANLLKGVNNNISVEVVSDNIINRYANLEYLVAMRFHALILGMKMGVKCMGINYDAKVEKLCKEANIPYISMSAGEDFDNIFNQMKNLDTNAIFNYANSKNFDWSGFEKVINS